MLLPSSGLVIRDPHIGNILFHRKRWELRGSPTKKRGKIGLIKSGSRTVVGSAELVDCIGPLSPEQLQENSHLHQATGVVRYEKIYAWVLDRVEVYPEPVPYSHPQGAIIWVKLGPDDSEEFEHMTKNELARRYWRIYRELQKNHIDGSDHISRKDNNEVFEMAWAMKAIAVRIRAGYKFDPKHPYWSR